MKTIDQHVLEIIHVKGVDFLRNGGTRMRPESSVQTTRESIDESFAKVMNNGRHVLA